MSEATQEAIRAALAAWLACSPQMRSTIVFGLRDDARCLCISARNPDDPEQADASQCAARLLEVLGSGAMLTDKELDELLPAWLPQRPAPGSPNGSWPRFRGKAKEKLPPLPKR